MKLSNQAMGTIMMALQKSLLEQSDIVPVLLELNFQLGENEELIVTNPPSFKVENIATDGNIFEENISTVGSD